MTTTARIKSVGRAGSNVLNIAFKKLMLIFFVACIIAAIIGSTFVLTILSVVD